MNNDYLLSDAEITVRLSVPEGLDVQEIKHTSDTRGVEYFFETGKNTFEKQDAHVVLTIHHFSELKLSGTVTAAAMVDGLAYSTLQQAIDAADSGDTITVLPGCRSR